MDKILCKDRESQERITRSYRGLVVSIAAGYQGKGISIQDLIQVPITNFPPALLPSST